MVRHLVYKQYLRKYYSYNKNKNIPRCAKDCSFKWYHEKPWKQLQNCVSNSLSFFLGHPILTIFCKGPAICKDKVHVYSYMYPKRKPCRQFLSINGISRIIGLKDLIGWMASATTIRLCSVAHPIPLPVPVFTGNYLHKPCSSHWSNSLANCFGWPDNGVSKEKNVNRK